jgi:stress-induced-phosphoprotein 1
MYRCHEAMNVRNNNAGTREETMKQAMEDPEVQEILADPIMRSILEQMQKDPKAAQDHMKNPIIAKKLQVLINAGVLQMR